MYVSFLILYWGKALYPLEGHAHIRTVTDLNQQPEDDRVFSTMLNMFKRTSQLSLESDNQI